ncbi:response regulator receiver (plasmid) [Gemmatirosa kalamazoonensis]|uniref:Response regulator receiver n=1 Tax=Gemmatirosa kalamazoonensis TaxID=861299 RepID=W0RTH8_9BACT|nr:LytTR family DNA-binding domain-containing protein [Gemmatirosa kalamazoonensis]AHG93747.1 response regulator receiver [Gemmatirosa kalamazoonensis]
MRAAEDSALRVLIVDDEPLARDNVRLALAREPDLTVVGECGDGDSAVEAIEALRPDLVFLDVQMPGLDGFDVIDRVGVARMPGVVFVTAYDAHALRAFEVHALDYLLKPFDDARLRDAVGRARRGDGALEQRLAALVEQMARRASGSEPYLTRFVVRRGDRASLVRAVDVDWIEADGNYVVLHTRGAAHRLRVSLRTLAEQLDPRVFARVHKSTIVNLDRVRELQPWFGGDYVAILQDGKQLRVSRSFAAAVLRPLQ